MNAELVNRLVLLEMALIRIRDGLATLPGADPIGTIHLLLATANEALDGDLGLRAAIQEAKAGQWDPMELTPSWGVRGR